MDLNLSLSLKKKKKKLLINGYKPLKTRPLAGATGLSSVRKDGFY
jgi:hypothetical protein